MSTIKINFDTADNPEVPTLVLGRKNGDKLGLINAKEVSVTEKMAESSEISFKVYKKIDGEIDEIWDEIRNFKLVYCVEWNKWFEISVEINEENDEITKTVYGTELGRAELSQINLYDIEINTEKDIERDAYVVPTVLYRPDDPSSSLLHRILEKAPHYRILHVDSTIKDIQRMFSFDDTSIHDAFNDIAEEIKCLFVYHSDSYKDELVRRVVSVYDLESNCLNPNCKYRGEFTGICPECGSTDILEGYGEDTGIFVTADEFAEELELTTDVDKVKNCFKLEAGDDLMTATVRNCNPNGSDYIWYITDDIKMEMSEELVEKLDSYDKLYDDYQNGEITQIDDNYITSYNFYAKQYNDQYANNYNGEQEDYEAPVELIEKPVNGYPELMDVYYNTVDFELYLRNVLMPSVEISDTSAADQLAKLITSGDLSPISLENLDVVSVYTANNNVLSMAKVIVDSRYKVEIQETTVVDPDTGETTEYPMLIKKDGLANVWRGRFIVTNYSDEEDTAELEEGQYVDISINDDYEKFVRQKIDKVMNKEEVENVSIVGLFKMEIEDFKKEMKFYCLNRLNSFHDACQACIDILVEQGIPEGQTWSGKDPSIYDDLYAPYLEKLEALDAEIKIRGEEIDVVSKLRSHVIDIRNDIQNKLDFQKYLGEDLWIEFCSHRREDKYSNKNYVSDGLDNAQLFEKAQEFIKTATKEIYKSAEQQNSISTTLRNLFANPKFRVLLNYFQIGNWIRVQIDDVVYKLRLITYEIDYEDLENISVEFSDITKAKDSISDINDILSRANKMATSYDSVKRQSEQGESSKTQLNDWVNNGLALTQLKIINNAENQNVTWDSRGILCREYLPETDEYDPRQLKIINRGLYVTDDNWAHAKAGIGNFIFYNPKTKETENGYGVIADTLVSNLILSEEVGIYNERNSITLDDNGFTLTINGDKANNDTTFSIVKKTTEESLVTDSLGNTSVETVTNEEKLFVVDELGNLVLSGNILINADALEEGTTLGDVSDPNRFDEKINDKVKVVDDRLTDYVNDIDQYMSFDSDTGLILGAKDSPYKTVIDNQGMYFEEQLTDNTSATIAYINNQQLCIPKAKIELELSIGNFTHIPHMDGSVSIVWDERDTAMSVMKMRRG